MDGWTDRRMDGRMHGWTDRQTHLVTPPMHTYYTRGAGISWLGLLYWPVSALS